ncbi:mediator of RNA polymerase II transcription subunit 27-like [Artemia franciscana]
MQTDHLTDLNVALNCVRKLRNQVRTVYFQLENGPEVDTQNDLTKDKEAQYVFDLQRSLGGVQAAVRDVEQFVSTLSAPLQLFQLGNVGQISLDENKESASLYVNTATWHRWADKVHEYAGIAWHILNQNSLKRSYFGGHSYAAQKRRRMQNLGFQANPQVDSSILNIGRNLPELSIDLSRPFGNSAVLQITIGRVIKAVVMLKGLMIEWVQIKSFTEDFSGEDGKLDIWTDSRYKVFRKVTEHANSAMLHFSSPIYPELGVKSFLVWLHHYTKLFCDPCKRCGRHLQNLLPPTWRDVRSMEPYHEECRL